MKHIYYGRGICNELSSAESLEWLVTNGIGGYASGTVANVLTRRYHGLLIAALKPPYERTLLVSKLDETIECDGRVYPIYSNRWANILVEPNGYRHIENFQLEGKIPVWTFSFGAVKLQKRIWMQPGANTTYIQYRLLDSPSHIHLRINAMVNYRNFHGETHAGDWQMQVRRISHGLKISASEEAVPFYILCSRARVKQEHHWYRNYSLSMEPHNDLPMMEDHLNIGDFSMHLAPGESVTMVLSTEKSPNLDGTTALAERKSYEEKLLSHAPQLPASLVLAADQFIVRRVKSAETNPWSIIAGYHWLQNWGRDSLISLPGLLLSTGRYEEAKSVILSYARRTNNGLLPNTFNYSTQQPEYEAADVALWFFEALRAYYAVTKDIALLEKIYPTLEKIIHSHESGANIHIKMDPQDGLIYAGQTGMSLTWMNSKSASGGITPRAGKPVEINALWYNALCSMADFARALNLSPDHFEKLAEKTRSGFERFWNDHLEYCYDVLDTPGGDDLSLRPNQILAVSLFHSPLNNDQQKSIVDICLRKLLTPYGLRSLSPDEAGYVGYYNDDNKSHASTYHQGKVWAWLIGPFISAHLRVYGDIQKAKEFLEPFFDHLHARGIGTISDIFDGEAPYTSRGCIAQAWSVGEVLRVCKEIDDLQYIPANTMVTSTSDPV